MYTDRLTDRHSYPLSTLPRITRVTQTQPTKATRLPDTNHQRVHTAAKYRIQAIFCTSPPVLTPFQHFSRREVQNPECFRYFAPRPQLNHPASPSPRRQRQHPHIVFTAVKQSISQHFPTPKTTSATSHQHLHIVFASISQHFPTSRTTWQRPHRLRDTKQSVLPHFLPRRLRQQLHIVFATIKQSISQHFPTSRTTWQRPHRLHNTKQSSTLTI